MSQPGQDAKFFQRGKIEVSGYYVIYLSSINPRFILRLGISCRSPGSGDKGQEIREEEDSSQEDRCQYNYGE